MESSLLVARFHDRQFIHGSGSRDGLGMIQTHYNSCVLYISSTSDHQALDPGDWGPLLQGTKGLRISVVLFCSLASQINSKRDWLVPGNLSMGFPGGSDGKESACNAGDPISILGWEDPVECRAWKPTPVLLPGKSLGHRGLVGYSPWDRKESDRTE